MLDALAAAAAQARGEEDEDATEADSDSSSDAGGASGSASQTYKHSVTGHNVIKPPLGCVVSKSGKSRLWTEHERALVHAEAARVTRTGVSAAEKKKRIDSVRDGVIARNLCDSHAEYFGPGTPKKPKGILSQDVAMILKRQVEKSDTWGGHRGPAISEEIKAACVSAMAAVVKTKAAAFSATFLQPVALGIIIAKGAGDRVAAGADRGRGVFCASKDWVRGLMKGQKWRNAKPRGDSRKVPNQWKALCWLMVLRVAFYVQFFSIPASHSSRAGSHDATCLSACANLPACLLTGMPALRASSVSGSVCPAYNVMIYHRPCILRIKLEAKGELRGAPTASTRGCVDNRRRRISSTQPKTRLASELPFILMSRCLTAD